MDEPSTLFLIGLGLGLTAGGAIAWGGVLAWHRRRTDWMAVTVSTATGANRRLTAENRALRYERNAKEAAARARIDPAAEIPAVRSVSPDRMKQMGI